MKQEVTKFDFDAAFKALDEIEIPKVGRVRPNRDDLHEAVKRVDRTSALIEEYYNLQNPEEVEEAKEDLDADIAKAKLAKIERIVDLDATSEEDIQPSYVGKIIIQCPQCMTLFYKDAEDIEKSDESEDMVNIGEECQHCGNTSGYMIIGKVAEEKLEDEAPAEDAEVEDEVEAELPAVEDEVVDAAEDELPAADDEIVDDVEVEEEVKESLNEDADEEDLPADDAEVEAEAILAAEEENSEDAEKADEEEAEEISVEDDAKAEEPTEDEVFDSDEPVFTAEEAKDIAVTTAELALPKEDEETAEEAVEREEQLEEIAKDVIEGELAEEQPAEEAEEEVAEEEKAEEDEEIKESLTEACKESDENLDECGPIDECGVKEDLEAEKKLEAAEDMLESLELDESKNGVSNAEFDSLLNNPLFYADLKEECDNKEELFDTLEELDEGSIDLVVSKYLTETYSNVKFFESTGCEIKDNKLILEGNIRFMSDKVKHTSFVFENKDNQLLGQNTQLAEGYAFTLNYVVDNKKLFAESLAYKYSVGKKLVEGLSKNN